MALVRCKLLLYIFVILYKNVTLKKFLKKKENYNIGYVCIPVTLLSLGIYLSSTEKI